MPAWRCSIHDSKLYAVGGFIDEDDPSNSAERYDFATKAWEAVAPMALARYQPGVAVLNGKLYAVGATTAESASARWSGTIPRQTRGRRWRRWVRGGRVPAVAVLDGKLYVVGGWGNGFHDCLSSVERYDPSTNAWEVVQPMASTRDDAVAALLDGKLYAVGGYMTTVPLSARSSGTIRRLMSGRR